MAKLPGLVNYSDDEDQSSSSSADEDTSQQEQQQQQKQQRQQQSSSTPSPHIQQQPTTQSKGVLPQSQENDTDIHDISGEGVSSKQVEPTLPSFKSATPPLTNNSASPSPVALATDRSTRLNTILRPQPIPGVENWGVPPEPQTECDPDRLAKIQHFLSLRRSGHRLNEHLQRNKAFRNPKIYAKLVEFVDLNETGSNFSPDQFDPTAFPPSSYIDGILETQQKLAEEKAQRPARSQVAFTAPADASTKFAAAMANAAKIANKIAKPTPPPLQPSDTGTGKRSSGHHKWDQQDDRKRHHHH